MNIKHYLSAAAALTMLAACSEYDPGMSENVVDYTDEELKVLNEYAENFAEHFGGIDPDHTWGFGAKGSEDEMSTRTQIDVNRNQWIVLHKDNQTDRNLVSITTHELMGGATVPGFPSSVDGLYHIWDDYAGSGDYTNHHEAITYEELANRVKYNNVDEVVPAGDVTDEEILYVSAWFRTHQNPTSDPFSADNFFVQTISKDYDRQGYGTMSGESTSSWAESQSYPYLQTLPIKYVLNGQEVQYDYNGNAKDPNQTGSPVTYELDYLAVQKAAGEEYEHINNFNSANTPKISQNNPTASNADYSSAVNGGGIDGTSHRMMEYVYETGTHDFEVHSSNIDVLEHNWVLKHLTFTGRDGKNYDGWYLAFDIAYTKSQERVTSDTPGANIKTRDANGNLIENIEGYWEKYAYRDYDGYYSNYIVKIIPGNGSVTHDWSRIMCEDLGNTYDYDFNDLVYDVYYTGTEGNYTAHIKVQAAGGTYPIFLGAHDEAYEVHHMLGHGDTYNATTKLYQPINVGTGLTSAPYEFTMSINSTNPDDIPIYVENPAFQGSRTKNDFTLPRVGENLTDAPQKICIPGNKVKWTKENQNIEWAYPKFPDWVNNMSGDCDFGKTNDWTKTNVQETYLFK